MSVVNKMEGLGNRLFININMIKVMNTKLQKRIVWVDWMKVIGIYIIIAGHLMPPGYKFVYMFSVPLFFIISGFLTKREESNVIFWKKLWKKLAIPALVLWGVSWFISLIEHVVVGDWGFVVAVTNWLSGIWGGRDRWGHCGLCTLY